MCYEFSYCFAKIFFFRLGAKFRFGEKRQKRQKSRFLPQMRRGAGKALSVFCAFCAHRHRMKQNEKQVLFIPACTANDCSH